MPRNPADEPDDAAKADIGLVRALSLELDAFFARCERVRTIKGGGFRFRGGRLREARIAAVESGPGTVRAANATRALLEGHRPDWIISCGFAGALSPAMRIGDVVIGESVRHVPGYRSEPQGEPQPGENAKVLSFRDAASEVEVSTPSGMAADPAKGLHRGRFLTTPSIIRTVAEKQWLAEEYQAIAVDMETFAVAKVCQQEHMPFLAIRSITDDLSIDLPKEVHSLLMASGAKRIGATLGALWNRPESAKDLWKLREHAGLAGDRLAKFLTGVVAQLHAETMRRKAVRVAVDAQGSGQR